MALFSRRIKATDLESLAHLDELLLTGKPVLVDFMQTNCQPCRTMDGIVNELAEEFDGTAHVVKANAAQVPDAFRKFKVMSTPTFILLTTRPGANAATQRWRHTGLVKKDVMVGKIESAR